MMSYKKIHSKKAVAIADAEKLFSQGLYKEGVDRIMKFGDEIENGGWALIMAKQHFEELGNPELLQLFVDAVEKFVHPPTSYKRPRPKLYLVPSENL